MTECPTCRKSTQGIITDPENLEICSVCGTILAESSITTEISLYIGSQPYKPKSELKSSDVAYLSSILHFYNMSGYLEEAKAIISKLRQTIYARVPKYSYGAIACILARKYSKPISLHQISVIIIF